MIDWANATYLESAQNPKIKQALRLRERRERKKTGLFLIEGLRELQRSRQGGFEWETLFVCPELFQGDEELSCFEGLDSSAVQRCSEALFRKISYRERPDGFLAIAPQKKSRLSDIPNPRLLLIAEAIEKPGNLGAILRTCDAAGVDGVIVCDRCTDVYNPNVVRSSVGTLFTQPVVEAEGEETLEWLKKNQVTILAATPSAELCYTDVDLTGPVAIAVGTEETGLSDRWMQEADLQVRIPMKGAADSLNVSMSAALLLYEAVRQRS